MAKRKTERRTPTRPAKSSTDAALARRAARLRSKAKASRTGAGLAHEQSVRAHIQAEAVHAQVDRAHETVHAIEEDRHRQADSAVAIPRAPKTGAKPPKRKSRGSPVLPATSGGQPESKLPFTVVGVGGSAGGFEAFTTFLSHLSTQTGMAIVIVQHLDPTHQSHLGELLAKVSPVAVTEIRNGMEILPNRIYVMPSNTTVTMERGRFKLSARSTARGVSMPIDIFFRSMAMEQQNRAIGILFSGSGTDGTLGIGEIKGEGGITFAQDPGTAKHFGMPGSAIAAGNVDFVLSPEQIAQELAHLSGHPYVAPKDTDERQRRPAAPPLNAEGLLGEGNEELHTLFMLLRTRSGVDFSLYRPGTLSRRIMRRMVLHKIDSLGQYLKHVQENPDEIDALFHDLLISVTGFFRDPNSFQTLQKKILPKLLRNRAGDKPLRIWSCGCSTGEEAYSLAIAVSEVLEKEEKRLPVQIFASDLNDRGIEKARAGIYHENILLDVSSERLRRFFTKVDGFYQVKKSIRDLCVFARQNVVSDPPFSNLDIITCRNVLIYLTPVLQKRIIPIFHYALKPHGYLLLGSSESIGDSNELFELIDKRNKIYFKKTTTYRPSVEVGRFAALHPLLPAPAPVGRPKEEIPSTDLQERVDRLLLRRYSPSGVLINDRMEVLQFRGQTGPYLEHQAGAASLNLLKMVREELVLDVRRAVTKAIQTGERAEHQGEIRMRGGQTRGVTLDVHPLSAAGEAERFFLVLFRDHPPSPEKQLVEAGKGRLPRRAESREITNLRQQLGATKDSLQAIIEAQEATNEELKSANEEIQSSNEELQSTNEELETAREELQSTNEELTTLNMELQNRNAELGQLNNDLTNLINSVNSALVIVETDLTIRRFTPTAEKIFNIIPSDVGRRLTDLNRNIQMPDLDKMIEKVIENLTPLDREVRDHEGRSYLLRIRPYRTQENRIEGVVLTLVDIDEVKRGIREVITMVRQPVLSLDADFRINLGNDPFFQMFQLTPEQTENRLIFELEDGAWDNPVLHNLLEDALSEYLEVRDVRLEHTSPKVGQRTLLLNARRLSEEGRNMPLIVITFEDITDRR
jgi:two-component system CheB/CheR fusion protein